MTEEVLIERLGSEDYSPTEGLLYEDVFELHKLYKKAAFQSNIVLVGPKGIGKTLSIAAFAAKIKCPIVTFDCSEDVRRVHLLGMYIKRGSVSPYILGPIPTAIEIANEVGQCILCFEEINALTPQMQKILNPLLDFRRKMEIPECKKVFRLKPESRLWVTGSMNTCFHPDTDVLTPDGLKKVGELKAGDAVYSLNMATGKMELDTIVNAWASWATKLVGVQNQHVDLRLTPVHQMVVRRAYADKLWEKRTVEEMASLCEGIRPNDTHWAYPKPFDLPDGIEQETIDLTRDESWIPKTNGKNTCRTKYRMDDFLDLLGWYISEGSTYSGATGEYKVYIAQNKPHNQPKIEAVLSRMEINFREEKDGETSLVRGYSFNDKVLYHALRFFGGTFSEEKKIHHELFRLSKRQLGILFESMYDGDGDEVKERTSEYMARTMKEGTKLFRSMRYSTKSPTLYKDVLWLAIYLGYTTTRHAPEDDGVGMHRIGLRPAKQETTHLEFEEVAYQGWVIDVEVAKNHTLCAGENGKFLVVSNCVYGGVYQLNEDLKSRLRMMSLDYPPFGKEKLIVQRALANKGVPKGSVIDDALKLAKETRQGSLDYALSPRDVVQLVEDVQLLGAPDALRLVIGKFEADDQATVVKRIESIYGVQLKLKEAA